MALPEKELSALELMIEHADNMSSPVMGAPKKKKKAGSNKPDFSFNVDAANVEDDDIEYYVGPGSRAKNRAAKARREGKESSRQIDINVNQRPQSVPVNQPNPREVEAALEDLFIAGERSGEDIVKAIKDGTAVGAKTQKALEDWMQWEKNEAFKEKNKAKSDPHGQQPGAAPAHAANDSNNNDSPLDDLLGGGDEGGPERGRRRGKRYGRNRGQRRGPGRNLPRRSRLPRLKGKLGAVLGIGAALGAGYLLKKSAQDEFAEGSSNAGVASDEYQNNGKPTPISSPDVGQTKQADDAAVQKIDSKETKAPSAAQDVAAQGASLALMGASKRIPIIGPALGNGIMLANDVQHINADETLSDSEKSQAKKEATGGAVGGAAGGTIGAVAGGWIGGILGSVVPVAGTAAGAALGATIGGILGDYFGSSVGEYVADKITDESDNMLADGEKDRKEKMEEYNDTTLENQDKSKTQAPIVLPFNLGGMGAGPLPGSGAGTYQGPMRAKPARRMDSKQVQDIASRAISEGGLGAVSEQFESGGKGVGTVSTGAGDFGGVSYGKHQLATNNGSMMNFLNSPEGKPFLQRFGGLAPGTAQFNSVYKDVANTQGGDFDKAQSDYITRTHYAPMVAKLQNELGVDLSQRGAGVKEMLYSTAVQYGSGSSVLSNAFKGKDINGMSDDEIIKAGQDYKAATTDRYFKSSSAQTQQSVAMRAANEKDVLLKVAAAEKEKKAVNTPKPVESESAQDKRIAEKFPDLPKGDPNIDRSNTSVDKTPVPDLTAKGPEIPKGSDADRERRLRELVPNEVNRIEPVAKAEAPVERQPLVTEGDIARQEAPAAPQVVAPTEQPKASARSSSTSSPQTQTASPGAAHTLDAIPVFLDDPMTNMITLGYM